MAGGDYTDDMVLPEGLSSGGQKGRVLPRERVYNAKYEMVSLAEASKRLEDRRAGKKDVISGGLDVNDDTVRPSIEEDDEDVGLGFPTNNMDGYDTYSDDSGHIDNEINQFDGFRRPVGSIGGYEKGDFDVFGDSMKGPEDGKARKMFRMSPETHRRPDIQVKRSAADEFLEHRERVELRISGLSIKIRTIFVSEEEYSITLLIPSEDEAEFIPSPGSEVILVINGDEFNCYFPGSYFKLPGLHAYGLCFIRAS